MSEIDRAIGRAINNMPAFAQTSEQIAAFRRAFPGLEFLIRTPEFPANPQEPPGLRQTFGPKSQAPKWLLWKPPRTSSGDDDSTDN